MILVFGDAFPEVVRNAWTRQREQSERMNEQPLAAPCTFYFYHICQPFLRDNRLGPTAPVR